MTKRYSQQKTRHHRKTQQKKQKNRTNKNESLYRDKGINVAVPTGLPRGGAVHRLWRKPISNTASVRSKEIEIHNLLKGRRRVFLGKTGPTRHKGKKSRGNIKTSLN